MEKIKVEVELDEALIKILEEFREERIALQQGTRASDQYIKEFYETMSYGDLIVLALTWYGAQNKNTD